MELQALTGLSGAAVVIALSNSLIKPFVTDSRFMPLLTVILGVVWNVGLSLALSPSLAVSEIATAAIMGILTGLAATSEFPISGGKSNTVSALPDSKSVGAE